VMTGDDWANIARGLYDASGQPAAVNAFFVSYVVRAARRRVRAVALWPSACRWVDSDAAWQSR
jgi:hypothetical protein